jgi:hypothetical protein
MTSTAPQQPVPIPLVWINLDETPIQLASMFQVQLQGPDEVIFNIGQTAPPMLAGTPEEMAAQAGAVPFVPCRTLARLSLTTDRMRQLRGLLDQMLAAHDQQFGTRGR